MPNEYRRIIGTESNDNLFGGDADYTRRKGLFRRREHVFVFWEISGNGGNDIITGGSNADHLFGNEGNDSIYGRAGNDFIFGGAGDDLLDGGTGSNYLDGGINYDTADYSNLGQAITLLPFGFVNKADGTQDQLINIEKIVAGISTVDTINSSTSSSAINANLTTGQITVIAPNLVFDVQNFDNVVGSNFNDTLTGSNLANQLYGNGGNDSIYGEGGSDLLDGGTGSNYLDGGTGYDTADYRNLGQSITLLPFGLVNKSDGTQDQLVNIENIIAGISTIDTIDSSTSSSAIDANLETGQVRVITPGLIFNIQNFDNITGTNFDDVLTGSNYRNNRLEGRGGADKFAFNSFTSGNDVIVDFTQGQGGDKLQISKSGFGVQGFDINNWSYMMQQNNYLL